MAKSRLAMLAALAAAALLGAGAAGDVVVLKNGNRLDGKVVARGEQSITVRIKNAEFQVALSEVKEIIEQQTPQDLYVKMLEALDEKDGAGHFQVAQFCIKEHLDEEAIDLLRQALRIDPNHAEAKRALRELVDPAARVLVDEGRKLAAAGKHDKARDSFSRAADDYPESSLAAEARSMAAESHVAQRNYAAAMETWRRVLEADRRNTRAYLGVIDICEQTGRFDQALQLIDSVLGYEKDEAVRKGCEGRRAAIRELVAARTAIAQDPANPDNYTAMGRQYEKLGLAAAAVEWMEKAVGKGSRDIDVAAKVARHYDTQVRAVKALRYWLRVKELAPGDALAEEADARIKQLEILKLIPEYMTAASAARRREILDALSASDLPFDLAEKALRQWIDFPEVEKKGIVPRPVQSPGGTISSTMCIPEQYDPDVRWPLIVALHAAGGTGENYIFTWAQHAQASGYLVVAPTADRTTVWHDADGRSIVLETVRDVCESFNVDPNRIFLDGTSMGAHGAWDIGLRAPDTWAALVSRSGAPSPIVRLRLPNALQLPMFVLHGLNDTLVPPDIVKDAVAALKRQGSYVEFLLDAKAGHSGFGAETPRVLQWLGNRTRDPYPQHCRFTLNDLANPKCFWLQAEVLADDVYDPEKPLRVPRIAGQPLEGEMLENYLMSNAQAAMALLDGEIKGNTIRVEARHVVGYTVLLDDRMVDLERPIEVYTNGKLSYTGSVTRSLPFMLEWARRHRDPEMLFSCHARVVVEGADRK